MLGSGLDPIKLADEIRQVACLDPPYPRLVCACHDSEIGWVHLSRVTPGESVSTESLGWVVVAGFPKVSPKPETLEQILGIVTVTHETILKKPGLYMKVCVKDEVTPDKLAEFTVSVMQKIHGVVDPQNVDVSLEYES